jgi:cell division transport system permease protein
MSLAAVTVTMVSLMALGGALVIAEALDHLAHHLERQVQLAVYLRDGLPAAEVRALRNRLVQLPGVADLVYVSKEDALVQFRKQMRGSANVSDLLRKNPLPASFLIDAESPDRVASIAAAAERFTDVEAVSYGVQTVDRLQGMTRVIRLVGTLGGGVLAVIALIIIVSTIRLTVFARRAEIEVMRLVGATAWFIRWPFVVEGAITGACGAALAVLLVSIGYLLISRGVRMSVPFLPLPGLEQVAFSICWKLFLWGITMGILGSVLAVRRYLLA